MVMGRKGESIGMASGGGAAGLRRDTWMVGRGGFDAIGQAPDFGPAGAFIPGPGGTRRL
jgi:uncharacterized protein YbjT (DUF2867 family)